MQRRRWPPSSSRHSVPTGPVTLAHCARRCWGVTAHPSRGATPCHVCAPAVAVTTLGRRPRPSPPFASRRTGPSASSPVSSQWVTLGVAGRQLVLSIHGRASGTPDLAAATIRPFAGDEHPPDILANIDEPCLLLNFFPKECHLEKPIAQPTT